MLAKCLHLPHSYNNKKKRHWKVNILPGKYIISTFLSQQPVFHYRHSVLKTDAFPDGRFLRCLKHNYQPVPRMENWLAIKLCFCTKTWAPFRRRRCQPRRLQCMAEVTSENTTDLSIVFTSQFTSEIKGKGEITVSVGAVLSHSETGGLTLQST